MPSAGNAYRRAGCPQGLICWIPAWTAADGCQNQCFLLSRDRGQPSGRHSMQHASFLLTPARIVLAVVAASCAAPCFAAGKDCEQLRAEVMRRYEAGGIVSPALQLLPSSAATSGKVVGSCDLGSRKLVYLGGQGGHPSLPASAPTSARQPGAAAPVLTECKDGTVSMGGSCKAK